MGTALVEPYWAPLTPDEVQAVLSRYPLPRVGLCDQPTITWYSPRPMSSAALVELAGKTLFIKRHDQRVRSPAQLVQEHAFAEHLSAAGVPVPQVLRTRAGASTVRMGSSVYEVHAPSPGTDLYRDAFSWTPFTSLRHARSAGAALARLHAAAGGFAGRRRQPAVLMTSCEVVTAKDPLVRVSQLLGERPGLARYLGRRPWEDDLAHHHLPYISKAAPLLQDLRPQWGHGDWHPSNLTWTSRGVGARVTGIFDLGLANKTFAVHDLAIALERSTVSWLDLAGTGRAEADLAAVAALLDGYEMYRQLSKLELIALAAVLPVAHLEYALSEVEYFADIVEDHDNADLAYGTYLIGHTTWFESAEGARLTDYLLRRASRRRASSLRPVGVVAASN